MSLSGNLGFVSLDEVLRLLTRSQQTGAVDIKGDDVHGRIFVTKGGVGLATTSDDARMRNHLLKSGLVDEENLRQAEAGDGSLAPIVEKSGGALIDLLREMTVESIYQLGLKGETFQVHEGQKSSYSAPKSFELESLLEDAKKRFTDWAEVSKSVSDLHQLIRFNRDLGEREEVKVDKDAWKVLSQLGSGASVAGVAEDLGTTEFWTARVTARLLDDELVDFETAPAVEETPAFEQYGEPLASWDEQAEADDDDVDPNESWWQEPEAEEPSFEEPAAQAEAEAELSDEPVEEYFEAETEDAPAEPVEEKSSIFGAYAPRAAGTTSEEPSMAESQIPTLVEDSEAQDDLEEDTEAFLEKVFSELDSSDEPQDEGYGLLRRRRMGSMRDTQNES